MKRQFLFFLLSLVLGTNFVLAWGATGHRAVAEIAWQNLKPKTQKKIAQLLPYESLANASTFADDIKSDVRYKKFYTWHFVNFKANEAYETSEKHPEGDLIQGLEYCKKVLKDPSSSAEDKAFYLKMLVHFIGDLHQPFHVGHAEDQGGNLIKVKWFGQDSNLHRVWDSDLITSYGMSYSELAGELQIFPENEKPALAAGTLMDWVKESQGLAETLYAATTQGESLGYRYQYDHFNQVKTQLRRAGYRLASVLEEVFR